MAACIAVIFYNIRSRSNSATDKRDTAFENPLYESSADLDPKAGGYSDVPGGVFTYDGTAPGGIPGGIGLYEYANDSSGYMDVPGPSGYMDVSGSSRFADDEPVSHGESEEEV